MSTLRVKTTITTVLLVNFATLCLVISGCGPDTADETPENSRDKITADSFAAARLKKDSVAIASLKEVKTAKVSDKTVSVVKGATTVDELKFELENKSYGSFYRSRKAERNEAFLTIRVNVSSKSKWDNKNGDFIPNLNVFRIEGNSAIFVGSMTYQLYKKGDLDVGILEQIFNYKETEEFICWQTIATPVNYKYVISVNTGDKEDFNPATVIAIINPEAKK